MLQTQTVQPRQAITRIKIQILINQPLIQMLPLTTKMLMKIPAHLTIQTETSMSQIQPKQLTKM